MIEAFLAGALLLKPRPHTVRLMAPRFRRGLRATNRLFGAATLVILLLATAFADSGPYVSLETPHFKIRYTLPDRKTALYLQKRVERVATEVTEKTGLTPPEMTTVLLAPDLGGFRDAVPGESAVPYWADGLAVPSLDLIVLKSPKILPNSDPLEIFIHEYVHILLSYHSGGDEIPTWLNEGLAMYLSGEWGWSRSIYMTRAVLSGKVMPLQELERGFPSDVERARTAYAESYYVIAFLRENFGVKGLHVFIRFYQKGFGFGNALHRATGLRFEELENRWERFLKLRFSVLPLLTSGGTLWFVMALLFLLAYRRKRRRARALLDEWDREEMMERRE
ncbi:MAG: hypothetical protein HY788_13495 [Deltaproteobacteria bacterium]|nr:hypothetical protein [Deltaproteobacteria bacterium]